MGHFEKLEVWKRAHALTLDIYKCTAAFPKQEVYGLASQMRRASASIGCNVAEGTGRRSDGELMRFLQIAMGSCSELEYQIRLARDLGYIANDFYVEIKAAVDEVGRMLTGLRSRVSERATRLKTQGQSRSLAARA